MKIRLTFEEGPEILISLKDTPCAQALYGSTPFEARVNLWGEEIYFTTPVVFALDETAKELVERGEVGYWPEGKALCLFFGPTPISDPGEIRPASPVNIVGQIISPLDGLHKISEGTKVRVEKI